MYYRSSSVAAAEAIDPKSTSSSSAEMSLTVTDTLSGPELEGRVWFLLRTLGRFLDETSPLPYFLFAFLLFLLHSSLETSSFYDWAWFELQLRLGD